MKILLYLMAVVFSLFIVENACGQEIQSEVTSYSDIIFYSGNNIIVKEEIESLSSKKINFKAQTSFTIPIKNRTGIIERTEKALTDIETFDTIPYYSKRYKTSSPLFRDIKILVDYTENDRTRIIITEQTIPPFNPTRMKFTVIRDNDYLIFKAVNIDKISFWVFPIISENKLISFFSAEVTEKGLECYGLGVADTASFFLMRSRIKDAFDGRTESLINWIHSLLKLKLGS